MELKCLCFRAIFKRNNCCRKKNIRTIQVLVMSVQVNMYVQLAISHSFFLSFLLTINILASSRDKLSSEFPNRLNPNRCVQIQGLLKGFNFSYKGAYIDEKYVACCV